MKIKTAVIGLGRIGSLLEDDALREKPCTHAGSFAANPECELAAGCDNDEERRNLFAEKWQVPVYDNALDMIRRHKPQIISIATHPDSHYHYCSIASKESVPVIICEKPLADTLREAKKIANLEKTGIRIITNHERRYSEDYIRTKKIIKEKTLGEALSIRAVLYMGKTKRLIDVLWHDGTHLADAIMFLTDGILKHRCRWGAKLTSRCGTSWLEGYIKPQSPKNAQSAQSAQEPVKPLSVLMEVGAGRDHLVFEIEFSFEKGRLRIGNSIFEIYESAPSPYAENFRSLKNTGEIFAGNTGYFANMVKDAVICIKDPDYKPVSGAANGLNVIKYLNSAGRWK